MKALNLVSIATEIKNNNVLTASGKKSSFRFRISQSVQDIINEILYGSNTEWSGYREKQRVLILQDLSSGWKTDAVIYNNNHIVVNCMNNRYSYFVSNDGAGGATVEFNGSLAALLQQDIIPTMSYVPGTLQARYEDIQGYLSIEDYCEIRNSRNGDETTEGERINAKFNNEIPCFAKAEIIEEKKAA